VNKTRVLTTIALILTTFLSVVLLYLGIDKFYYVLAGGRKFATFPDLRTQLAVGGSYLLLSIIYLIWLAKLFSSSWVHSTWSFRQILLRTSAFWTLAFIAYPLGNDTYLYLHSGLMNLSGANPYLTRAGAFVTELSAYVDWGQTSTYGVVSQAIFSFSAFFVSISPSAALYIFKVICLLLHLFNGYLIWKWLPIPERGRITIAYLLHPLLLMEQVSSAHVDILISTSLILFAVSYAREQFWMAFIALWGGFLSKTLPIIWAPWVAVTLLRQGHWKWLLSMIAASGVIVAGLWVTVMPELAAWQSILNPGVSGQYQSSLMAMAKFFFDLVRIFKPEHLDLTQQRLILSTLANATLIGFFGFYCWQLHRSDQRWNNTPEMLLEDMGWTTLVLMLFATAWLMPWYCSILITFAALIPKARLFGLTTLAFALSSSAQYLLGMNASLKSLVSIGVPVLTLIVGAFVLKSNSLPPAESIALEPQSIQEQNVQTELN
jgi:alpha-1,6-mannosyltransferase